MVPLNHRGTMEPESRHATMSALHGEIRDIVRSVRSRAIDERAERAADVISRAAQRIDELHRDIVDSFPERAKKAASEGHLEVVLAEFNGSDIDERSGLSTLFLWRGPARNDPDAALYKNMTFLKTRVLSALCPFVPRHHWDTTSHKNVVYVRF